ncbi:MAG: polysaccharide biosynthesis protein, partial [Bryobacterales bacterium]|nr:polysaccharide biosynthesis protein [Bryobacterales bacterium]
MPCLTIISTGMSQSHLILRNTVALAAARVTEKGANAALGLLVARYLGASALGVYSAAIVVLTVVTLTSEMGSTTFLVREIARDRKVSGTYLVHFGAITILLSLLAMAAALLLVPHLDYSPQLTACVYVIVFATIPAVLRTMQEAVFVAHQRASFIVWSTAVGAVINLVAGFVLLRRGSGIVAIIAVFVAVQYIMSFFYLGLLNRYVCRLRMSFDFRVAWALIREVRTFAGSSILGGVLARPEVIILALSRNDTQLGYYAAALRVVELWGVVAETYMRNVLPVLSHAYIFERSRCQGLLAQSVKLLLA